MDDNSKQQSTSILELLYLIRAKNKGEMNFTECLEQMLQWARAVIAEADAKTVNEDNCG